MDKMKPVFEALNQELAQANFTLTIICVGGYVLEHHGLRATQDVDAFYQENQRINEIIARVGQRFNLNTHVVYGIFYDLVKQAIIHFKRYC